MADRAPVPPKPEAEPIRGVCAGIGCGRPIVEHVGGECPPEAEGMGEPVLSKSVLARLERQGDAATAALVAEVRRLRGEVEELTWKVEDLKGDSPLPHCSGCGVVLNCAGSHREHEFAWHRKAVAAESRCKALREAATTLRNAQRAYMAERNTAPRDRRMALGEVVGRAGEAMDRALAAEEGEGKA